MTRGGYRKNAKRPSIPESERKKAYGTRLKPEYIVWLKSQRNASKTLEKLIQGAIYSESIDKYG